MKNLCLAVFLSFFVFANAQDSTRSCRFSMENQLAVRQGSDFVSLVYTKNRQQFFAGLAVLSDWALRRM